MLLSRKLDQHECVIIIIIIIFFGRAVTVFLAQALRNEDTSTTHFEVI